MSEIKNIRTILPLESQKAFDDIDTHRVLGASNHIRMIFEMFVDIVLNAKSNNVDIDKTMETLKEVSDYYIKTRGEASQAISNAILKLTSQWINRKYENIDDLIDAVSSSIDEYNARSKEDTDKIIQYTCELSKDYKTIMIYDYSSTVEKAILAMPDDKLIIIPESRVISGGVPYLKSISQTNKKIKFIPDVAIAYYLEDCDAVFMGAETFYADGTGFNTIGSDIVGVLCKEFNVPLYFLTPLIKLDLRPTIGKKKNQVFNDLNRLYGQLNDKLDYNVPELLGVSPKYIEAYICEEGIVPSTSMYSVSMEYAKKLRGGNIYG